MHSSLAISSRNLFMDSIVSFSQDLNPDLFGDGSNHHNIDHLPIKFYVTCKYNKSMKSVHFFCVPE